MAKFLNEVGLAYFWSKIKSYVDGKVVSSVGDYTINGKKISTNPTLGKGDIGLSNVTDDAQVKRSEMGAASGVATLGSDGKVPSSQLPSYVDDVLEYENSSAFPGTGESGKIYVATDTNLTYRWSGTSYVQISQSIALGETSSTAYAGDKGKANRDAISSLPSTVISNVSLGTVSATGVAINVQKATKSGLNYGSPAAANFNIPVATTSAAGLLSAADKAKIDGITGSGDYTLPAATSGALGGIKIGYTESGNNIAVKLDGDSKAYVTVESIDNDSINEICV